MLGELWLCEEGTRLRSLSLLSFGFGAVGWGVVVRELASRTSGEGIHRSVGLVQLFLGSVSWRQSRLASLAKRLTRKPTPIAFFDDL